MIPSEGFNALLKRAQAGDRMALDSLLADFRPYLEKVARSHGASPDAGQSVPDLVQEVCLRIWRKLDQFKATDDDRRTLALFRAWVVRIVGRLSLNRWRNHGARRRTPAEGLVRLGDPDGSGGEREPAGREPTPSATARHAEQLEWVRAALERLPSEPGREILRLHFFEGLSLREVAGRVGLSYDQVRERYRTSMRFLERELGPLP
jgi:RNA polymerase sigma factor (sigma-70 family)